MKLKNMKMLKGYKICIKNVCVRGGLLPTGRAEGHKGLGVFPEDGLVLGPDGQPGHEDVDEVQRGHGGQVPLQLAQNQQLHLLRGGGGECVSQSSAPSCSDVQSALEGPPSNRLSSWLNPAPTEEAVCFSPYWVLN